MYNLKIDKFGISVFFISIFFVFRSWIFVFFGNTWLDELGYMYDSWLSVSGNILYHDFWVKVGPIMYLLYGKLQLLFGFNLVTGRLISVFISALLLFSTYLLVRNLRNRWSGFLAISLMVSSSFLMYLYSSATPYALTMLFIIFGIYILTTKLRITLKLIISAILFSLAVLTRTNMFPLLIVLLIYFLFFYKFRQVVLGTLASILTFIFVLFPYLKINFIATMQGIFGTVISSFYPIYEINLNLGKSSLFENFVSISSIIHYNLIYFILLGIILYYFVSKIEFGSLYRQIKMNKTLFLLFACTLVSFVVNTYGFGGTTKIYWVYSAPLIISVISIGMSDIYLELNDKLKKLFIIGVVLMLVLNPAVFDLKDLTNPAKKSDIEQMELIGFELKEVFGDEPVVILGDTLHIAYSGKLNTYSALTHRNYLFVDSSNTELVMKYHFYNFELLETFIDESSGIIMPGDLRIIEEMYGEDVAKLIESNINENFYKIAEYEFGFPKKYDYENPVIVYRRNE